MERGVGLELRVRGGRAVLTAYGDHGPAADLSDELRAALDEWARVTQAVTLDGAAPRSRLVSRRGRQLAARLAVVTGHPVAYVDPLAGGIELVGPEPTPWATGLTVSAAAAAVAVFALVALAEGLAEIGAWAPPVALLVVTAGLAPSVWLGRRTPVWRWVAHGVAAGIVLSWVVLLLSLLG